MHNIKCLIKLRLYFLEHLNCLVSLAIFSINVGNKVSVDGLYCVLLFPLTFVLPFIWLLVLFVLVRRQKVT